MRPVASPLSTVRVADAADSDLDAIVVGAGIIASLYSGELGPDAILAIVSCLS